MPERLPADEMDAAVLDALRHTYERSDLIERAVLAARQRAEGLRDQHEQEHGGRQQETADDEEHHRKERIVDAERELAYPLQRDRP